MTWNRNWNNASQNIFEALKITKGDHFAILYNPKPSGKEQIVNALLTLAKKSAIQAMSLPVVLDEGFNVSSIEGKLYSFFEGTKSNQRKFFFTTARRHFGPSRRAVHKLISVDPEKLAGFTVSLPTDNADIVAALANTSPKKLLERGEKLKGILSKATKIKITSGKGTDLSFDWDVNKRKYLISAGFPHTHEDRWDNLGGEVYTAPLHTTVNGRLVIDGAIGNMGLVKGIIVVDVKNGAGMLNRKESTAEAKQLDEFDRELNIYPCAKIVGEFGIGTTPNLKLTGELLNDEKVEGTIHIAFGDSYSSDGSGGENNCDAHTDCMITAPTVDMTINGKTVHMMATGKFLI